ncbi:MAG: hypothetical protein ABIE74_00215 [Pseudomonadota bacterium]
MIEHAWTTVCQKSIIDKDSNNISLDILEQLSIQMPSIPADAKGIIFPIQIEIVSLWYKGLNTKGKKYSARLKIKSPSDDIISKKDMEVDLTNTQRYRTRIKLNGLPIKKQSSGYFYFITEVKLNNKWKEVSKIPVEVRLQSSVP